MPGRPLGRTELTVAELKRRLERLRDRTLDDAIDERDYARIRRQRFYARLRLRQLGVEVAA